MGTVGRRRERKGIISPVSVSEKMALRDRNWGGATFVQLGPRGQTRTPVSRLAEAAPCSTRSLDKAKDGGDRAGCGRGVCPISTRTRGPGTESAPARCIAAEIALKHRKLDDETIHEATLQVLRTASPSTTPTTGPAGARRDGAGLRAAGHRGAPGLVMIPAQYDPVRLRRAQRMC